MKGEARKGTDWMQCVFVCVVVWARGAGGQLANSGEGKINSKTGREMEFESQPDRVRLQKDLQCVRRGQCCMCVCACVCVLVREHAQKQLGQTEVKSFTI